MALINFNCNNVPDDIPVPVPPGKHRAVIVKTEMGEVKGEKNTQQLKITWQITDGPAKDGKPKKSSWI